MQYVMRYWAHRVCEFVISLNTSASTNWIEMYRKYISNCLESYRSRAAVSRAQNSIWLTDCCFAATVERTHKKTDDSKQKDADGVDLMEIKSSPCTRLWWEMYVRDFFSVRVFIFEADENGMKDRMKSVRHRRFTIVIACMRCFATSNTEFVEHFHFVYAMYTEQWDTLDPFSEMKDNDKHDIYQKGNADENVHVCQQRQQTAHSAQKKTRKRVKRKYSESIRAEYDCEQVW